jgi:hypothetical protein
MDAHLQFRGLTGSLLLKHRQEQRMKCRIAIWASAGFLIAAWWAVYAFAKPMSISLGGSIVGSLAGLSCPIALASLYLHFGVTYYWALLANAVTYALVGLMVEIMRRQLQPAK